jgi:hypothetical protein
MASGSGKRTSRSFLRDYFYDHPVQADGSHLTGGKHKVYCRQCFDAALLRLKSEDQAAVASGSMHHIRPDEVLRSLCELLQST